MKVHIEAFGCTMNYGEAQAIGEMLEERGHRIVSDDLAEMFLIATCTVIEKTELRMLRRIDRLVRTGKPLVITGCMASAQKERLREHAPDAVILPPDDIQRISEITEKIERIQTEVSSDEYGDGTEDVKGEDRCDVVSIVPIAQGCLGNCAYCITRIARGPLSSYLPRKVLQDIEKAVGSGAREIQITTQDTAAYGRDFADSEYTLPKLVEEAVKIPGDFRLRIGMANPNNVSDIIDGLIGSYKSEKVFKFIHLPVQSGSDEILGKMNRGYGVRDFLEIVRRFREEYPDITLSTDIIVGFPGETERQFEDSVKLLEEVRPNIVNVTRFSPRPGTPAAEMKEQVVSRIAKERSRLLTDLRFEISRKLNEKHIGREERVLITERGKEDSFMGRTQSYLPVVIREDVRLGEFVDVEITGAKDVYLRGEGVR